MLWWGKGRTGVWSKALLVIAKKQPEVWYKQRAGVSRLKGWDTSSREGKVVWRSQWGPKRIIIRKLYIFMSHNISTLILLCWESELGNKCLTCFSEPKLADSLRMVSSSHLLKHLAQNLSHMYTLHYLFTPKCFPRELKFRIRNI